MISNILLSETNKIVFINTQIKALEVARSIDPKSCRFGFNLNSSYQSEIYTLNGTSSSKTLSWESFINAFPEYLDFCEKFGFYKGITIIGRPIKLAHRHGTGERTLTFPLCGTTGLRVFLVSPSQIIDTNKHELLEYDAFTIDQEYTCKDWQAFSLPGNHFHFTETENFMPGKTLFTVWHEAVKSENSLSIIQSKLSS